MAELPPGISPTRDPDTYALRLGVFDMPSMPGAFNVAIGDVSKRAMAGRGTRAEREALEAEGGIPPGFQWVTIPDDPNVTEWTARPLYWTGAAFDDPLKQQHARFIPRSDYFAGDKSGINGNLRTSVMAATWPGAPAGQYRIDFSFSIDGPEPGSSGITRNDMIIAIEANRTSLRADYVDDISPITRNYTPFGLYNHTGGDLRAEAYVFINGTTGTVYTAGTAVLFQYLGPYLNG